MRAKICIIQKSVPRYRVRFFEQLRGALAEVDVELVLIFGRPENNEFSPQDAVDVPWGVPVRNVSFPAVGGRALYWQPSCLKFLRGANLVIVEQAGKLLLNYVLFAQHALGIRRLAFWGHGRGLSVTRTSRFAEAIKQWMSRRVWWWFAYNDLSAAVVREMGFPPERITSLQNTIDAQFLVEASRAISEPQLEDLRARIGITGRNVGIFCGAMYPQKRIPFLLESCRRVRREVGDFEMILIGAGADGEIVRNASRREPWLHYVGPKFDTEKVPYWKLAKISLIPAAVGLVIIDSFALGVPLLTTAAPGHGPEIDYLKTGVNGILVDDYQDSAAYAREAVRLLRDEPLRQRLVEGSRQAAGILTLEAMVERFTNGIQAALNAD